MTELVYNSYYYRGYNNGKGLINSLEQPLIRSLIDACRPTDMFINSTWFEFDDLMEKLLIQDPKRLIIYSGMDWHDTDYRKKIHSKLFDTGKEVIYIGNTDGANYFSFWLFFIEKHFSNFYRNTPNKVNIGRLFMCLNRKRHSHRVELVNKLLNVGLDKDGYVSLGGTEDIPPILIENDLKFSDGDNSAAYNNEGIVNDINSLGNIFNWENHLINIVTETTVSSSTFISEKTWKPILGLKPYMILGDYKIYSYLKSYGIDTFDDIFGTGYQNPDYHERINWIVSTLLKLKNIDKDALYKQLLPRLEKNRDKVKEIIKINNQRYSNTLNFLK